MSKSESGATDGVRTRGIGHHKPALYRLSYSRHQIQLEQVNLPKQQYSD